jgi:hypothetical protein
MPPRQAAAMVCFCDLPLGLIKRHLKSYGHFGIGLSKDWGRKNGVTPVLYMHENSSLFTALSLRNWSARLHGDLIAMEDFNILGAHMKQIEGYAWRKDKRSKQYMRSKKPIHFYDEREWRYVPTIPGQNHFLTREEYGDREHVDKIEQGFPKGCSLTISPDYIQYLIVPNDRHVLKLAKFIRDLYPPDDATLVTTAIMTIDNIHADV